MVVNIKRLILISNIDFFKFKIKGLFPQLRLSLQYGTFRSFHVPGLAKGKQYSTNTDYMRQNGTERQMNDPRLVKFMWQGMTIRWRSILDPKIPKTKVQTSGQ